MKYAKYFTAIILFVCIAASAYAQDITGTVTDTENNYRAYSHSMVRPSGILWKSYQQ